MPPLNNARHEAFVRAQFEGHSIDESYAMAGYSKNRGNACRLNAIESIQSRLRELQAEAAANAEVTVASICRELDAANEVARQKGQAAAMVSAATLRAKLAGLMVERIETGAPGDFDGLTSTAQIVDGVLERLVIERFLPVDAKDREVLIQLYERHLAEVDAYISAIQARPVLAEKVNVRRLNTPWQQLETRSAPARLRSNGR
jgi:hypothetical protein